MKTRGILAWATCISLSISIFGCDGANPPSTAVSSDANSDETAVSAESSAAVSPVGTWLSSKTGDGDDEAYLMLNEGGVGAVYSVADDQKVAVHCSWKKEDGNKIIVSMQGTNVTYVIDGETLTLDDPSESITLKRVEDKTLPPDVLWAGKHSIEYSEPLVVIDDDAIRVTITARGENIRYDQDYGYEMTIENKSDADLGIGAGDCYVNGEMAQPQFISSGGHIGPGKKDTNVQYVVLKDSTTINSLDEFVNFDGVIETHPYNDNAPYSPESVTKHDFHVD